MRAECKDSPIVTAEGPVSPTSCIAVQPTRLLQLRVFVSQVIFVQFFAFRGLQLVFS